MDDDAEPMQDDIPQDPPNVVSLTDFIKKSYKPLECQHQRLVVDPMNRRVECRDCKRDIDPMEAMIMVSDRTSEYQRACEHLRKQRDQLSKWVPRALAVQELYSIWRSNRLPMCPHCKKGITAEGLNRMGWVSRAYAEALERETEKTSGNVEPIT